MKRKALIILTIIVMAATQAVNAATSADALLDKCVKTLTTYSSVTIGYTLSSDGGSTDGAMTVSGSRFLLDSPQLAIWFDSKTLWSLAKAQNEVNVTTPTEEELQQINPLMVLAGFRQGYNATELKSSTPGEQSVKLTPKSKGGAIDAAVVNMNEFTHRPVSIVLTLSNRTTVSIRIRNIAKAPQLNDASFRFNAKNYPGVDVIDLR